MNINEPRDIYVDLGVVLSEYSSFKNSIKKSTKEDFSLINGSVVVDYYFDGANLVLIMDNGFFVKIYSDESSIVSEIFDVEPDCSKEKYNEFIKFNFPSGGGLIWRAKKEFDNIVGCQIALFRSDGMVFLHAKGRPDKKFDCYYDKERSPDKYLVLNDT